MQTGVAVHNKGAVQLFVCKDEKNWFGCGLYITNSGYQHASMVTTKGVTGIRSSISTVSTAAKYKITVSGRDIYSYYYNGSVWVDLGSVSVDWDINATGLYVYDTNFANGYGEFDYIHFSTIRATAASGVYYSKTFDLGIIPSSAGTIAWSGTLTPGTVEVSTRTSPDALNWSAWSAPYPASGGSATASPLNRYLQFSVTISENPALFSPAVDRVAFTLPGISPLPPDVSSTTNPGQGWGNSSSVVLGWVEPAGNPAPVWAYYYAVNAPVLSGTSVAQSAVILPGLSGGITLSGLADGRHEFRIVAQGEPSVYPLSAETMFIILKDTVAPSTVTVSSPTHPTAADNENHSPVFGLAASDATSATAVVSGLAGYHYVFDSNPDTAPGITNTFTAESILTCAGVRHGSWWLHARAKDRAGNLGPVASRAIKVRYTAHVIEEKDVHAVPHPIRGGRATIRYVLLAPAQSVRFDFLNATGNVVAGINGPIEAGARSIVWDTAGQANGIYYCRIRARRQDGKEDQVIKKLALIR